MTVDLILGTAGHIDHGKTSLIRALTGVDTDRLPEEKERGITIELGFAELQLGQFRLGIVDVPGHERFVRNMLAGATGMDLAMLVVAADDSVKQQTREHLDVLRLLDLSAGVIVLTKCDLADPDWVELVEAEVRDLVQGTFLAEAPIVRTSAATGEGLDALREALTEAARKATNEGWASRAEAPFRMPIDRSFTIAGHGTVVTGSVASGCAEVGDRLMIQPGNVEVRVRGLQNHDRPAQRIQRGQRAAINLAGVRHDQIVRGQELVATDHLVGSRLVTARLSLLPTAPWPLKDRSRIRVHVGTAEIMASVVLLEDERLPPGKTSLVQMFLAEPAISSWNQPFVVRSQSPVQTIGGGHVLVPSAKKLRKVSPAALRRLRELGADDRTARASAAFYFAGLDGCRVADLPRLAGIADGQADFARLVESGELVEIAVSPRRTEYVHQAVLAELGEALQQVLTRQHDHEPLRSMLDRFSVLSRVRYLGDDAVLNAVLNKLRREGRIRLSERGIGLADRGPQLSTNERKLLTRIIERYREARFQPPTVKEIRDTTDKNRASVESLIQLAASDGDLVEVAADTYLHASVANELKQIIREAIETHPEGVSVSEIRERLDTSRKFAVPFCEYLDRSGFTKRMGDRRVLA